MYLSLETLREQFERSSAVQQCRLTFSEYALLCRLREGATPADVSESLFVSSSTIYRAKRRLVKKFKARSFEEALIKAGEALFSERKRA